MIMMRRIEFYKNFFMEFYQAQNTKFQQKIDFVLDMIQKIETVPVKFLKHIEGTKGLYEIRVSSGNNIARIFCFFDKGKLIILLHGFIKKKQKTPKKEIAIALKLMGEYYEEKK